MSALLELLIEHDGYERGPNGEVLCKHCGAGMKWAKDVAAGQWGTITCPTANCPNSTGMRLGGGANLVAGAAALVAGKSSADN